VQGGRELKRIADMKADFNRLVDLLHCLSVSGAESLHQTASINGSDLI